jgi:lipopolysaccharide transport system permease protein
LDTTFTPPVVIEAGHAERHYWSDAWRYRELFYYLAWRDVIVRYKQTVIGPVWTVIRPILTMVVFSFVFSKLARIPTQGVPYPLFFFAALLPWQFFSFALSNGSESLVSNANLVSKVYFPRILVPASSIAVNLIDLAVTFGLVFIWMAFYHFGPSPHIVWLAIFLIEMLVLSLGLVLWFSALTVIYRDFRFIVGFIMQFGFYLTPIGYGSQIVIIRTHWWPLYYLNPMSGVVDGFRWAILGRGNTLNMEGQLISASVMLIYLFVGYRYFRSVERKLADHI